MAITNSSDGRRRIREEILESARRSYRQTLDRASFVDIESILSTQDVPSDLREEVRRELTLLMGETTGDLSPTSSAFSGRGLLSTEEAREAPPPPRSIGKYPVLRRIAEHGQGEVFLAVHPQLGIQLAIKRCRAALDGIADRERLREEGRILGGLDHPGIARIFDLELDEGRPYLAMEYIAGVTLDQERAGGMDWRRAADIVTRVAHALHAAHGAGVLHLDIKPANIIVGRDGTPRLIDFGLARHRSAWRVDTVAEGIVIGTPDYISPEQARGENRKLDRRTDIFLLGGVLYFLLTGKPPFDGETRRDTLVRARAGAFDPELLERAPAPRGLKDICRRALSPRPEDRYADAGAVARALEALVRPRRRWGEAGGGLAALALGLMFLYLVTGATDGISFPLRLRATGPGDRHQWADLVHRVPLAHGDLLKGEVEVAAGHHAAVFVREGEAGWRLLGSLDAEDPERRLVVPSVAKAMPLEGKRRTEVLLVCARRSAPIGEEDIAGLWPEGAGLPDLPASSVLRLYENGVTIEASSRGFGEAIDAFDSEAEVEARLRALGKRLGGRFDGISGLAFLYAGEIAE